MAEQLMGLIDVGVDWVLWLLFVLGAACLGVFANRLYVLTRYGGNPRATRSKLDACIEKDDLDGALKEFKNGRTIPEQLAADAIGGRSLAPEALGEMLDSRQTEKRMFLQKGVNFLGTIGSNAPFIGLFGTVLGIIRAFHDLSMATISGPNVVMKGISEALVATAVGLMVAIPAVIMHNYFVGRIGRIMRGTDALVKIVLSLHLDEYLKSNSHGAPASVWGFDDMVQGPAAAAKDENTTA